MDWGKALASQLIVWHHLCWYGPVAPAARPLADTLLGWLANEGRLAVQVFLVIGGFLAARSLLPRPGASPACPPAKWPQLLWLRYRRLARPLWPALLLSVVAATLARHSFPDADTPSAPSLTQFLANGLLVHDWLGLPALSAGLWYVAIDLQLFMSLALLGTLAERMGQTNSAWPAWALVAGLGFISLFWWNRQPALDTWAPYFFGSYALGVLAHWAHGLCQAQRHGLLLAMALTVAGALLLEWRPRVALAGGCALLLASGWGSMRLAAHRWHDGMRWLARISYAVFLVHYPVSLAVNALALNLLGPDLGPATALMVLLATWGLSLATGHVWHKAFEHRHPAKG